MLEMLRQLMDPRQRQLASVPHSDRVFCRTIHPRQQRGSRDAVSAARPPFSPISRPCSVPWLLGRRLLGPLGPRLTVA